MKYTKRDETVRINPDRPTSEEDTQISQRALTTGKVRIREDEQFTHPNYELAQISPTVKGVERKDSSNLGGLLMDDNGDPSKVSVDDTYVRDTKIVPILKGEENYESLLQKLRDYEHGLSVQDNLLSASNQKLRELEDEMKSLRKDYEVNQGNLRSELELREKEIEMYQRRVAHLKGDKIAAEENADTKIVSVLDLRKKAVENAVRDQDVIDYNNERAKNKKLGEQLAQQNQKIADLERELKVDGIHLERYRKRVDELVKINENLSGLEERLNVEKTRARDYERRAEFGFTELKALSTVNLHLKRTYENKIIQLGEQLRKERETKKGLEERLEATKVRLKKTENDKNQALFLYAKGVTRANKHAGEHKLSVIEAEERERVSAKRSKHYKTNIQNQSRKNAQLRAVVKRLEAELEGVRTEKKSISRAYACRELIDSLSPELGEGFSSYNISNLAKHLNWIINTGDQNPKTSIERFKQSLVEKDPAKAKEFYAKLESELLNLKV